MSNSDNAKTLKSIGPRNKAKVVLLGESSVGKSSLVERIIWDKFYDNIDSTIGGAYHKIMCRDVLLDIWDTAGQERFLSLTPIYYRESDIVIMVFDLSAIDTINRIIYYLDKLIVEMGKNFCCIIVGNKKDLVDEITLNDISNLMNKKFNKYNLKLLSPEELHNNEQVGLCQPIDFKYVSSKTGQNIEELKDSIAKMCNYIALNRRNDIKNIIRLSSYDNEINNGNEDKLRCQC